MAVNTEYEFKTYAKTVNQIKTVVGATAPEIVTNIYALEESVRVVTEEGVAPAPVTQRNYIILMEQARSLLGFVDGEYFYGDILLSAPNVTITTRRRLV